jgi:hypothetical protein
MAIQKVVFLLLLLLLLLLVQFYEVFSTASVSSSAPDLCKKHGLEDYTLIQENQCSLHDIYSVNGRLPSSYSVLEVCGACLLLLHEYGLGLFHPLLSLSLYHCEC